MKIGIAGPITTEPLLPYLDKILPNSPKGLGGTSIVQIIIGLLKNGTKLSVYSLDPEIQEKVILKGELLTIYYGPFRKKHRMRDLMQIERDAIHSFIIEDKPDLVNAHWTYEYALGAIESGLPVIITVRDWAPKILFHKPDPYRLGRLLMNNIVLRKAKHLNATSPYIAQKIKKYVKYHIPIIPNSINDNLFKYQERQFDYEKPVIVSVNNGFGKLKNVKTLLKAFEIIKNNFPSAKLKLIGIEYGPDEAASNWARRNKLSESVEFIGYLDQEKLYSEYDSAHLLVHPSKEESFGNTLIEAMSRGLPVLGGKESGAVPWVLKHGAAGILVDIDSPMEIARKVIEILSDKGYYNLISKAGYIHTFDCFRSSKQVQSYISLYNTIHNLSYNIMEKE